MLGCLVPYNIENVINMWRYNQEDENEDDVSSAQEEKEEDTWASFCTNARHVRMEWKTSLSKKMVICAAECAVESSTLQDAHVDADPFHSKWSDGD